MRTAWKAQRIQLGKALVPGDWIALTAPANAKASKFKETSYWVGKTVRYFDGGTRCYEVAKEAVNSMVGNVVTKIQKGEVMVRVRWYTRADDYGDDTPEGGLWYQTWEEGEEEKRSGTMNSTSLCITKFHMKLLSGPPLPRKPPRGAYQRAQEKANERQRVWNMSRHDVGASLANLML